MFGNQTQNEEQARQALSGHLEAGEELLAFTQGAVVASFARNYYLGLTGERLILVELSRNKPDGRPLSLRREIIQTVRWMGGVFASAMQIQIPKDTLRVSVRNNWKTRARELADLAGRPGAALTRMATSPRLLSQQVEDLQRLGFLATAAHVLQEAVQSNPALSAEAAVAGLQAQVTDARLALRTGAGFLFANVLVAVSSNALVGLVDPQEVTPVCVPLIVSAIIDLGIAASLWQGQTRWKGFAILRVVLGALVYGFLNAGAGDYLSLISNIALAVALVLVLTGDSRRWRTYTAIAIFGLGYMGGIALLFAVSFFSGLLANVR